MITKNISNPGTKIVNAFEYQRKYYDVEVELDLTAKCTKRIYIDEIDQYRQDMNKEMLTYYDIDKHYEHKDENNETNRMLAEDIAIDETEEEDYIDNIEVHNVQVITNPKYGQETTDGDIWRCVICDEYFTGFGNNPEPVKNYGDCCNSCNTNKVIPARVKQIITNQELKE